MAKILIIDANVLETHIMERQLHFSEFKVIVARRGDEGLAMALMHKPVLVFIDTVLPDKTGFQICNEFRRLEETKDLPIVMMSGLARYPNQQQFAMERGIRELLPKPLQILQLGEVVERCIPNASKPEAPASARKLFLDPLKGPASGPVDSSSGL